MRAFSEAHFIGLLKVTMIAVLTDTPTASSIGFVDTTSGRDGLDEAAAGSPTADRIITNTAIESLFVMYLSNIEPDA